ncbi:response regulator [Dehalobacter sp. DCM]|uniref:response regulator n=1 Tax=Dehalobacter sp. DCM TaxID=2907827 RepID=UPI00308142B0|nr:response regulator [Dehalobacter sp. DCM]
MEKWLLIVEDDRIIRMAIEKFAQRKNWKVVMAEDGFAALDAYQKYDCAVIFMDCQMPGLDGYQTTQAIRQLESQKGIRIPIIAMTADVSQEARESCLNAGMDDFLMKPLEMCEFYASVERWAK